MIIFVEHICSCGKSATFWGRWKKVKTEHDNFKAAHAACEGAK